ncbi:MAG: PIN domain-containing protein [Nanoarchaeota archaeon]
MFVIDTYALIEWFVQGNENYRKFFEEIDRKGGFITELTILEFYHRVYHIAGKEKADDSLDIVIGSNKIIDLNLELIKQAAVFRSEMLKKRKQLSYADCVNYMVAKNLKVKLLTGDNDFKELENVEFVK